MRIVIQRVSQASVSIAGTLKAAIGPGLMILVGICDDLVAMGPDEPQPVVVAHRDEEGYRHQ